LFIRLKPILKNMSLTYSLFSCSDMARSTCGLKTTVTTSKLAVAEVKIPGIGILSEDTCVILISESKDTCVIPIFDKLGASDSW
jgi:hypothetical protein